VGCKLVGYLRVSTAKQGDSGLGLEAQDAAIRAHRDATGSDLVASYTEVETGKEDDMGNRPELLRAIAHANRSKATLVIAKLDRLARSVYVTATLHKAGVDFVACDNPTANRLTIQILAAVAENEARMISERTRAALAAYKARGGKLGASLPQCRNLTDAARAKGVARAAAAHKAHADKAYTDIAGWMAELRREGRTLAKIAEQLNVEGHTTRRGAAWNPVQVARVLARASRREGV
jgi:DNA invertase Pin-like site-specific DNA recombinase